MATCSSSGRGERMATDPDILIVEPFYCGSHRQLVDCLMADEATAPRVHLVTMSGKKWHWRARVAALHLASAIPRNHNFRVLFSSSVLNLAELVALRGDLAGLHKVLYFHENQLHYPVRKHQDRDFQYGYNQILSCLVADSVLFNSCYNMESFLTSVPSFLKLMPDYRPQALPQTIRPKCSVLYFPVHFPVHFPSNLPHSHAHPQATLQAHGSSKGSNSQVAGSSVASSGMSVSQPPSAEGLRQDSGQCCAVEGKGRTAAAAAADDGCAGVGHMLASDQGDRQVSCVCCTAGMEVKEEGTDDPLSLVWPQATGVRLESHHTADTAPLHRGADTHTRGRPPRAECSSGALSGHSVQKTPSNSMEAETLDALAWPVTEERSRTEDTGQTACPTRDKGECGDVGVVRREKEGCLHIVWPHRWEHDKDPAAFFNALFRLQDDHLSFLVSVLGERFTDVPTIFGEAAERLKGHVRSWGYQEDKRAYYEVLQQADVVVSTARHEFFGVAMLEAVSLGCYPLCPRSLVYPELYPDQCLYSTPSQLYKRLKSFCQRPHLARNHSLQMDLGKFSWQTLRPLFLSKLHITDC